MIWTKEPTIKIFALSFSFLLLGLLSDLQLKRSPLFALEPIPVSYPGPAIMNLPVGIAMQRGFFQEQNLEVRHSVIGEFFL